MAEPSGKTLQEYGDTLLWLWFACQQFCWSVKRPSRLGAIFSISTYYPYNWALNWARGNVFNMLVEPPQEELRPGCETKWKAAPKS